MLRHQKQNPCQRPEEQKRLDQGHEIVASPLPEVRKVSADIRHGKRCRHCLQDLRKLFGFYPHHAGQNHHHEIQGHLDPKGNAEPAADIGNRVGYHKQDDSHKIQTGQKAQEG